MDTECPQSLPSEAGDSTERLWALNERNKYRADLGSRDGTPREHPQPRAVDIHRNRGACRRGSLRSQTLPEPERPDVTDGRRAEVLSKHQGILDLSGLTTLSDSAAQALAKMKGGLWLNGLGSLSVGAARGLSAHAGDLYLRGLVTISDEVAEALAQHTGYLSLAGLTEVPNAAAHALSKHKGFGVKDFRK